MEYVSIITHMETYSIHTFGDASCVGDFGDVRTTYTDAKIDYLIDSHYISNNGSLKLMTGDQEYHLIHELIAVGTLEFGMSIIH